MEKPRKVIVLGSGALKIGEAGEFDYSGSQAIKALKEEGMHVILINPNIATIQTNDGFASRVYFLPVNADFVEKVIEKERPEGILLSFGGQTALNCGLELWKRGVLKKYNVNVLGTPITTINATEDRALFAEKLKEIDVKVPRSTAVYSIDEATDAAKAIGYPVIIRSAFALGGQGSEVLFSEQALRDAAKRAFAHTRQILVEEYLDGWKEIEYEVMRDYDDNCIIVCNMENFDPMGIHTGESIVVAPSQTLSNNEYHKLREISIKVVRHLGIIGECNIQFALSPNSDDYRVIEVNARLSRSSALASKATGYPIAFIAAKLAIGYSLPELKNAVTKKTTACFEPALDYIVVKIPRWDLDKFKGAKRRIGSEMKSVGEVMAIGRTFEEASQKAIRMLDIGASGLVGNDMVEDGEDINGLLECPTDVRLFAIVEALKKGFSLERIHQLTKIDAWFLHKINNVIEIERTLRAGLDRDMLLEAKRAGFSDGQIAAITGKEEKEIKELRKKFGIVPVVKQIDTLGAEYPAETNYLYLTYNGNEDDVVPSGNVIVLGSGPYRIGSSVEFDWCCVSAARTLKELDVKTTIINCNPETVSTDYDESDRLYFEELSFERVSDIYEKENAKGIILSMGGQIPNNIAMRCLNAGMSILGTNPRDIDRAEDRHKFSSLLDELGVEQPEWKELTNMEQAKSFALRIGYPVVVRPSYVLSGSAMNIAMCEKDLEEYLKKASKVSGEHPVVISKFITEAKEIEMDAVASKGDIIVYAISEHVENAGVHSGDATMITPPQKIYVETAKRIKNLSRKIAKKLNITGPFNIQFIAKNNEVKVIECNLRASRSFPFVSKVFGINFVRLAVMAMMNKQVEVRSSTLEFDYIGVKAPQFSFSRIKGADPLLNVEMASTGEVGCLDWDVDGALLKSIISTGFRLPKKHVLISINGDKQRGRFLDAARTLHSMGFSIFATEHTSKFLKENGVENVMLHKIHEKQEGNVLDSIMDGTLDLVINIPGMSDRKTVEDEYEIRRHAADFSVPLITNLQLAMMFIDALAKYKNKPFEILALDEYYSFNKGN